MSAIRQSHWHRGPALSAVDAACVADANASQTWRNRLLERVAVAQRGVGIYLQGKSVVAAICMGQLGSLLPHVLVPSTLAAFLIPEWHLTGAQAGLLAGSGAAGYMCAVPVLATLTDRIDARKILMGGSAVSAFGTLLFGLFANSLWSGVFFNAIAGVGFAGAYMPGLKALTDRLAPGIYRVRSRSTLPAFRWEWACRFWCPNWSRKAGAGGPHSSSPRLGRC